MRHLIVAAALLAFAGLDVVFVEFSETSSAALTFAVLSYLILLILSGAAGSLDERESYLAYLRQLSKPFWAQGRWVFLGRIALAALIPIVLLLLLAYIPDLDDPLDPSATIQLGATFAVF